jgi:hypothetical protein
MLALYSHGDSVVWGAELENKQTERFSYHLSNKIGAIDCNNASAGVSNDYIYRQTMRDVSRWIFDKNIWSEETRWVRADELIVSIGWTSPTRFEWWTGKEYQQERLWVGYDKWGDNDKDRTTEDQFVLHQTEDIPSYIRTFNQIISLSAFLDRYNIPYYFFNTFYDYRLPDEPEDRIDKFGKRLNQLDFKVLWNMLPDEFTFGTMYDYIKTMGEGFLPRNHPTKEAHKEWANFLIKELEYEKR